MSDVCPKCGEVIGGDMSIGEHRCRDARPPSAETVVVSSEDLHVVDVPNVPTMPSSTFAHYEIIEEIGRGGCGVVYRARDINLDRTVALKVLLAARHASKDEITRFYREASAASQLQHPNLVPIYEFATFEEQPYYTMALIEGRSLSDLICSGELDVAQSLEIVATVADALGYIHAQGIVHRDLKPGNILINSEGEPLVTDFGLVKILEQGQEHGNTRLTRSGMTMGTPYYMSPEQAAGRQSRITGRSDIYSLGCILYELLTGRPPFDDDNATVILRKHMEEEAPAPSTLGVHVDSDVETICLKCLENEPERRYRSAGALALDIRRFLNGEPIAARRASMFYIAQRKLIRHKVTVTVGAIGVAALLMLSALYIVNLRAKHRTLERALYSSTISLAHRNAVDGNVSRVNELLASCPEHLRDWEWRFVGRRARQEVATLGKTGAGVRDVVWAPDGRWLAEGRTDGTVTLWDAAAGRILERMKVDAPVHSLAGTAQGDILAAGDDRGGITLWRMPSGKRVGTISGPASPVRALTFSSDGRILASGCATGRLTLHRVSDLGEIRSADVLSSGWEAGVRDLGFSLDGTRLVCSGGSGEVSVLTVPLLEQIKTVKAHTLPASACCFTPDGTGVVSGGHDDRALLLSLNNDAPQTEFKGHVGAVLGVAAIGDPLRVITASSDSTIRMWDPATGAQLRVFSGHTTQVNRVAICPTTGTIASAGWDGTVKLWCLTGSTNPRVLPAPEDMHVRCLAFDPESRRMIVGLSKGAVLVFDRDREWGMRRYDIHDLSVRSVVVWPGTHAALTSSSDGTVKLWDIETGEVRRTIRICPSGNSVYLDCSADGRIAVAGDSGGTIHVWFPTLPRPPRTFKGPVGGIKTVALNPAGTVLAVSDKATGSVSLWDIEGGRKLTNLPGSGKITFSLAFNTSGTRLAVGDIEGRIDIYDAVRALLIRTFEAHVEQVRGICYNPEGTRLASASMDQLIKVWDPVTGRELLSLKNHTQKIYCVRFSPDGALLASGGRNGQLRLWLGTDGE